MLIILGALVFVAPFSGLPMAILTWILPLLGLIGIGIGVSYRTRLPRAALNHEADPAALS